LVPDQAVAVCLAGVIVPQRLIVAECRTLNDALRRITA